MVLGLARIVKTGLLNCITVVMTMCATHLSFGCYHVDSGIGIDEEIESDYITEKERQK